MSDNQPVQQICVICGHIHDEATEGAWESLPDEFTCPECGALKCDYEEI